MPTETIHEEDEYSEEDGEDIGISPRKRSKVQRQKSAPRPARSERQLDDRDNDPSQISLEQADKILNGLRAEQVTHYMELHNDDQVAAVQNYLSHREKYRKRAEGFKKGESSSKNLRPRAIFSP